MSLKKHFMYAPLAVVAVGGMALSLFSCGNSANKADSDSMEESFAVDSVSYVDSLRVGGCLATCTLAADYPVSGNEALVKNVRGWIAEKMSYSSAVSPDSQSSKVFDGIADGKIFLDSVGTYLLGQAKVDFDDFVKRGFDISYEYMFCVREAYKTDTYVTFSSNNYVYLGGAHGGTSVSDAVFSLKTGEQFGWNMFVADSLPALKEIIKNDLMTEYFKSKDAEDFRDALLVNPDTLPLPSSSPYFLADGVHFVYQQYEIAPYAAGMPGCVVPYSRVMDMFTPAVKDLFTAGR